ncbi:hypothetical protein ABMA28_015927 [Loxostege sticticalis]|uniref:Exonuclease domain-containing protein n=1 Tax=Loxostege sticticalis TaxID=481309 RepID=A0ABD0TBR7_LOXSC
MRKLAIDCEMVGSGNKHLLAKVALVDEGLSCVYNKFVAPTGPVTDYRTPISGITEDDLRGAPSFKQEKVLGERIQDGPHDPVQDARTAMKLYKKVEHKWQ